MTNIVQSADLAALVASATQAGPQWAHESDDLDVTLLSWAAGHRIDAHVNHEVDVAILGITGTGTVRVDDEVFELQPGRLLLVPKGRTRSIEAGGDGMAYLSLHRRRRGLIPTWQGRPLM